MPDFRNLSELANYLAKNNGTVLMQSNIFEVIKQEAQRLEQIIKDEIDTYYHSYTPVKYVRTYNWINSLRVSEPKLEGNTLSIKIYFDDNLAYHPSVIGADQPDGYVPWLMNSGWSISQSVQPRRYRFTDFSGTHYINDAIAKYNATNKYGFIVTVESKF